MAKPETPRQRGIFFARTSMPETKSLSVMDADKIDRSLTRIAHEIVERHREVGRLVLVGIRTRGVPLARRLQRKIGAIEGKDLPLGILDINLYRDDITSVGPSAILKETIIHFPIDDRPVILVEVSDLRTAPWGYAAREILDFLAQHNFRYSLMAPLLVCLRENLHFRDREEKSRSTRSPLGCMTH